MPSQRRGQGREKEANVSKNQQNRNRLAAHGFSEKAEKDLDIGTDKLRKAFNDAGVRDVSLTRDEASAIFLRMGQLEVMLFTTAVKAK